MKERQDVETFTENREAWILLLLLFKETMGKEVMQTAGQLHLSKCCKY
jgi:hypothetical protein